MAGVLGVVVDRGTVTFGRMLAVGRNTHAMRLGLKTMPFLDTCPFATVSRRVASCRPAWSNAAMVDSSAVCPHMVVREGNAARGRTIKRAIAYRRASPWATNRVSI